MYHEKINGEDVLKIRNRDMTGHVFTSPISYKFRREGNSIVIDSLEPKTIEKIYAIDFPSEEPTIIHLLTKNSYIF